MDISRNPPCRLDFVFASGLPLAVILRRGPTRRVRMITWNTKTDVFEDGEWWHGRAGILYRLDRRREIVLRDFNPDTPPPLR